MSKLIIKIEQDAWSAEPIDTQQWPAMVTTMEIEDPATQQELESVFLRMANLLGFTYVGAVECKKLKSVAVEE